MKQPASGGKVEKSGQMLRVGETPRYFFASGEKDLLAAAPSNRRFHILITKESK